MNDLFFIKYEPKLMFLDTLEMSCETEQAHRRLADFIWYADCVPKSEAETLQRITKAKQSDWLKVFGELKMKGWFERGGFFIHAGIVKALNQSKADYAAQFNKTAKANKLPPIRISEPDKVTGIVTLNVTLNVTPHVTSDVATNVTPHKSESESESCIATHTSSPIEPPVGFPKTADEAKLACAAIGCPESFAVDQWNQAMSRSGRDHRDVPIRSWSHYLAGSWGFAKDRAEQTKLKTKTNHATNRPTAPDRNAGTYNTPTVTPGERAKIL